MQMTMDNQRQMSMAMDHWRGFSAYEVAVRNGFSGTEAEWLESLRGSDGRTTSVNGVAQQNGSITLTGADMPVSASDSRRLSDIAALLDELLAAITITDNAIDVHNRTIDNALFR